MSKFRDKIYLFQKKIHKKIMQHKKNILVSILSFKGKELGKKCGSGYLNNFM